MFYCLRLEKEKKEIRKLNANNIEFLPNRSCYQNDDIESWMIDEFTLITNSKLTLIWNVNNVCVAFKILIKFCKCA